MLHGFAGCHRFDFARNLQPSPLELRSKLSGDRIRAVLIRLLERAPDSAVHRCRYDRDAEQDRCRKQQKKFLAKGHRDPASGRKSPSQTLSSQTSASESPDSFQSPGRPGCPVAHACARRTRQRQMKKRDDGVSREQTALGLIQIVQRVAARRRRECGLRQSQLPRRFAERRGWIGTRQRYAHQADVFRSRQRYLHGDANFARVERNALGDQLGLRVPWIVA